MIGWQWHQLDHMQMTCTSLKTDNHASTSSLSFWATVCKTVCHMLSDSCLSCLFVLSVTLVCCGQTVGWINMELDIQVGLGPGQWPHCVRWGPSSPQRGTAPQFSAHICCGQMAGWIKMPLGREVGLGPGHIVLDGDPAPPKRGHSPQFSDHTSIFLNQFSFIRIM